MNMTDEILNSWTDADNYLADRIEADEEKINTVSEIANTNDYFVTSTGGGATRSFRIIGNTADTGSRITLDINITGQQSGSPIKLFFNINCTNGAPISNGILLSQKSISIQYKTDGTTTYYTVTLPTTNMYGVIDIKWNKTFSNRFSILEYGGTITDGTAMTISKVAFA